MSEYGYCFSCSESMSAGNMSPRSMDCFLEKWSQYRNRTAFPVPVSLLIDCFLISEFKDRHLQLTSPSICIHKLWGKNLSGIALKYHEGWLRSWIECSSPFAWQDMAEELGNFGARSVSTGNIPEKVTSFEDLKSYALKEFRERWVIKFYRNICSKITSSASIENVENAKRFILLGLIGENAAGKSVKRRSADKSYCPVTTSGADFWALNYVLNSEVTRAEFFPFPVSNLVHEDGQYPEPWDHGEFLSMGTGQLPNNFNSVSPVEWLIADEFEEEFERRYLENSLQRNFYQLQEPDETEPVFRLSIKVAEYPDLHRSIDPGNRSKSLNVTPIPNIKSYLNSVLFLLSYKLGILSQARGWFMQIEYDSKRCFGFESPSATQRWFSVDNNISDAVKSRFQLREDLARYYFIDRSNPVVFQEPDHEPTVNIVLNVAESDSELVLSETYDHVSFMSLKLEKNENDKAFVGGVVGKNQDPINQMDNPDKVSEILFNEFLGLIGGKIA